MAHTLLLFSLAALVVIATPGPTMLLALNNGSRFGVRASLPGMLGAVLSDLVLVAAVAIGLGALLAASEFWFSLVKWLGVAYLAFLGLRLLGSRGLPATTLDVPTPTRPPARDVFARSFLVAVTNPKGYLFLTAFLPQFIDTDSDLLPQYLALGIVFAAIDFLVMGLYAAAGAQAMRWLRQRGAVWIERVSGVALLAMAGSLALYRRQA